MIRFPKDSADPIRLQDLCDNAGLILHTPLACPRTRRDDGFVKLPSAHKPFQNSTTNKQAGHCDQRRFVNAKSKVC
ncbi:MAG TPA: hypothetical protein DDZ51_07200 [Planctomycetaceae bacterium]|nr:hypothetical protein [Planctomycetaceae bacterium]